MIRLEASIEKATNGLKAWQFHVSNPRKFRVRISRILNQSLCLWHFKEFSSHFSFPPLWKFHVHSYINKKNNLHWTWQRTKFPASAFVNVTHESSSSFFYSEPFISFQVIQLPMKPNLSASKCDQPTIPIFSSFSHLIFKAERIFPLFFSFHLENFSQHRFSHFFLVSESAGGWVVQGGKGKG